ncbi:MAG TPA: hypothetical protein V6C97_05890, partial [Oculatellaceae cyanobacterium]
DRQRRGPKSSLWHVLAVPTKSQKERQTAITAALLLDDAPERVHYAPVSGHEFGVAPPPHIRLKPHFNQICRVAYGGSQPSGYASRQHLTHRQERVRISQVKNIQKEERSAKETMQHLLPERHVSGRFSAH